MKMRLINIYWLLAIVVTLIAVGCSGSNSNNSNGSNPTAYQAQGIF